MKRHILKSPLLFASILVLELPVVMIAADGFTLIELWSSSAISERR